MTKEEIKVFIEKLAETKEKNIIIIDYGNVSKWEKGLKWKMGIKQLSQLIKSFASGAKYLRRFYYGSDYKKRGKSTKLTAWSSGILEKARMNRFEVVTKDVKYIIDKNYKEGFVKKCDFDIEIAVDLIKMVDSYDNIILFSGDGDFAYLLKYLAEEKGKKIIVFGARDHIGGEIYDIYRANLIEHILYAEDFEYRLLRR